MAEENKEIVEPSPVVEKSSEEQVPQQPTGSSSSGMLVVVIIAILISIVVAAFSFFLFQKLEQSNSQLNELKLKVAGQLSGKLDTVSGKFNNVTDRFASVSDRISRFNDDISNINSSVKQQEGILKQQLKQYDISIKNQQNQLDDFARSLRDTRQTQELGHQQLSQSLDMLYKQKGKTRNEWVLSEVEYLLLIANHSLLLSNDVNTAVTALQSADSRLLDLGDPGIIKVRKLIADELIQLKAVPDVDIAGIQATLSGMIKHVSTLEVLNSKAPTVEDLIKPEKVTPKADTSSKQDISTMQKVKNTLVNVTDKFLNELKSLVVFRNKKVAASELIAPEQKFFLQQNISLKLESARKALLDGRNDLFHSLLSETKDLLTKYFNSNNVSVKNFLSQLNSLSSKNLSRTLPDISFSIKELKKYMAQLEAHRNSAAEIRENN